MGELLAGYMVCALMGMSLPNWLKLSAHPIPPFMPFQANYILWKIIGFSGIGVFQARWLVQWLHSERHQESKIPMSFWWLSLAGAFLCLCYFLRQQDSVGVCGYLFTFIPCTRNLMLIYRKQRLDLQSASPGFEILPTTDGRDRL